MGFWGKLKEIGKKIWELQPYKQAEKEGKKLIMGEAPIGLSAVATIPKTLIKAVTSFAKAKPLATVTATIGGFLGYGVLKESPKAKEKVLSTIKKLPQVPKEIIGYGEEVGKVIEGERAFGKEDVIKGLKTAGVFGAVVGAGALIIPKIKDWRKAKKTEEGLILGETPMIQTEAKEQLITEKPIGIEGETPITPETISLTAEKKPYKRRRAKKPMSIRQSVRVNIINRTQSTGIRINKKYINDLCFQK